MSNLLMQLIKALGAAMGQMLTPEVVKSILDKAFDTIEEMVKDSKTQWDDVLVLPMMKALRKVLDVPDND